MVTIRDIIFFLIGVFCTLGVVALLAFVGSTSRSRRTRKKVPFDQYSLESARTTPAEKERFRRLMLRKRRGKRLSRNDEQFLESYRYDRQMEGAFFY